MSDTKEPLVEVEDQIIRITSEGDWNLLRGTWPDEIIDSIQENSLPVTLITNVDGKPTMFEGAYPISVEMQRPPGTPIVQETVQIQYDFSLLDIVSQRPPTDASE